MDMMSLRRRVLVNQNKLVSASGNPLTFNTPLTKPLKECVVRFTPKQSGSGTPSPENVREIVGKNGITVWQSGKNLLPDGTDDTFWQKGYINSSGNVVSSNEYLCTINPVKIKAGTYVLSATYHQIVKSNYKGVYVYDKNGTKLLFRETTAMSLTFTVTTDAYIKLYMHNILTSELQLEHGSEATAYEPFTASVETSVSFPAVGKNLFNGEWRNGRYIDGVWNNTNTWRTSKLIPVEPNTTYCVSVNEQRAINHMYYNIFDRNGNWIGSHYGTSTTTTADTVLMTICNTNNVVSALTDIQLEKGSTATAYEPFDNAIYGGYVDLVAGEVVAEWTKVDMGEQNWSFTWNTFNTAPSNFTGNGANGTPTEVICDIYPSDINAPATEVGRIDKNIRGRANYKHICIRDDDYATAADFKTAVTGHYLAYKLAEPIHYPLSPRILTTLQGNNVMWSDANGDITVRYWTR